MKTQKNDSNNQTKFLAVAMIIAGAFIWLISNFNTIVASNLLKGIGIFLFIVGIINTSKIKKWSELSEKEKKIKIIAIIIGTLTFIAGILFYFLY